MPVASVAPSMNTFIGIAAALEVQMQHVGSECRVRLVQTVLHFETLADIVQRVEEPLL